MTKKIKNIILAALSLSTLAVPLLAPMTAYAALGATDIQQNICGGTDAAATSNTTCDTATANTQVSNLMTNIINLFSLLVGIVSVIMIIIGGFQYVTANGDTGKIGTAKNTIIFALVGLIIVAMAQFIVHFILGKIAGYT